MAQIYCFWQGSDSNRNVSGLAVALIVGTMAVIILIAELFGVFPVIQYSGGLDNAVRNIRKAAGMENVKTWLAISRMDNFFNQKLLDQLFVEYKRKAEEDRKNGMVVEDIDELINEDELALRSWQGVVLQIPGP